MKQNRDSYLSLEKHYLILNPISTLDEIEVHTEGLLRLLSARNTPFPCPIFLKLTEITCFVKK